MPGSIVTLEVDGSPMRTYVAVPEGDGPFPAVTVAQHRLGVDVFIRGICDRLAEAGFAAAAPDHFHRKWSVEMFDEITALPRGNERAEEALKGLAYAVQDDEVMRDMNAALACLREHPQVSDSPAGVIGFCGGGRVAYLVATRSAAVKATACFYPGGLFQQRNGGPSTFQGSDRITSAVIAFSGSLDQNPSPEDMERLDKELTRLQVEHEVHVYDGVAHAFMDPTNTNAPYSEEIASDAWSKAIAFFNARLKKG